MQVSKKVLIELPMAYSLAVFRAANDEPWQYFAGSEGDGPLLHWACRRCEPVVLAEGPGGFISLVPWPTEQGLWLITSQSFKPGFQAEDCRLAAYAVETADPPRDLGPMPFAHRIDLIQLHGQRVLLASTLCSGKATREDWSQPGGVFAAVIEEKGQGPLEWRPLAEGLRANHGMDRAHLGGTLGDGYLLSCREGLFHLALPPAADAPWPLEQLAEGEHSDAFAFDAEGRGTADIFAIRPFHGNVLCCCRFDGTDWRQHTIAEDLSFGHVVWAGEILGQPGLIAGARRGEADLRLYRFTGAKYTCETIDTGIGAAQLRVYESTPERARLLVSARETDEVLLYELTP